MAIATQGAQFPLVKLDAADPLAVTLFDKILANKCEGLKTELYLENAVGLPCIIYHWGLGMTHDHSPTPAQTQPGAPVDTSDAMLPFLSVGRSRARWSFLDSSR
jgi:hypothetical protein